MFGMRTAEMTLVMSKLWYALHVRPRFESVAAEELKRKGYEVFSPTYETEPLWAKSLNLPLFPGYIFARFDLKSRRAVLFTEGVRFILGAGQTQTPLPDLDIAAFRQVVTSGLKIRPWPHRAGKSGMVQVRCGPLKNLTGVTVEEKGRTRLIVSSPILPCSVAVDVQRDWLVPLRRSSNPQN